MNHREAKSIVDALPGITQPESLVVRAIAFLETGYGNWGIDPARGAGSNNMGAITVPSYQPGSLPRADEFLHEDSRPDGSGGTIKYVTAFRKYSTPEAGFADLRATALRPDVLAVIDGPAREISAAMFANHYYTGTHSSPAANIDAHAGRLQQCLDMITSSTGEPGLNNSPKAPSAPGSDSSSSDC